jgi:hypothetical protein
MERRDNLYRNRFAACFLVLLAVCLGIPGCATMKSGPGGDAFVKSLWQSRDQFVAIEKQDRQPGFTVPANAHPTDISVDRLHSVLESIVVRIPGKEKTVQLFSDSVLKVMSEYIREGLALAAPDEDVTFAVIGHYPALMGLMNERKVSTGRVFCQDGQISIIFGDVMRDVKDNEDRRLYPFLPGLRTAGEPRKWSLAAKQGMEDFTMKRPDWVIFPIAGPAVPVAVPTILQGPDRAGTGSKAINPAETREKPAAANKKSVEERLLMLNDLRNKKLITEEEYRVKRLEILNEL